MKKIMDGRTGFVLHSSTEPHVGVGNDDKFTLVVTVEKLDSDGLKSEVKNTTNGLLKILTDLTHTLRAGTLKNKDQVMQFRMFLYHTIDLMRKHQVITVEDMRVFFEEYNNMRYMAEHLYDQFLWARASMKRDSAWYPTSVESVFRHRDSSHIRNIYEALTEQQKKHFMYELIDHQAKYYYNLPSGMKNVQFQSDMAKISGGFHCWKLLYSHYHGALPKSIKYFKKELPYEIGNAHRIFTALSKVQSGEGARELILLSQIFGFIQKFHSKNFPKSYQDIDLTNKLGVISLSTQFLSEIDNIYIYLDHYDPTRFYKIWSKEQEEALEELSYFSVHIEATKSDHDKNVCKLLQLESVDRYFLDRFITGRIEFVHQRIKSSRRIFQEDLDMRFGKSTQSRNSIQLKERIRNLRRKFLNSTAYMKNVQRNVQKSKID
ncbi:hypothetical protein Pst134EA_009829 [Puccinia striiformis f. sp. tritici]|nr:hypothetical protein Pst134EA_009829 [Puccinia striiformis f. sp. tritici]KAH9469308.1 hypothetical protein Pst134EA_009829 [Puccinia striiformis f. sp. tritici]